MNKNLTRDLKEYMLSEKEFSVITQLRLVPYGEVVIVMHDGQPDRIDKVREKIKL